MNKGTPNKDTLNIGERGALVTGAAKGIGRAIALALAEAGFNLGVHYHRSQKEAAETCELAEKFGVKAVALKANVCDNLEAEQLVRQANEQIGPLAVLVNNVGNYSKAPVLEMDLAEWHDMLDSNLNSTYYTCRAVVPYMRQLGFGRIINLGFAGTQNQLARPTITAYVIAKTGVNLLTKAIAKTEIANGITANVVAPGVIENSIAKPTSEIPAGRLGNLEEVSRVVLQLVSQDAGYITGQMIEVAGGWGL